MSSNPDTQCPACSTPYGKRRRCYRCAGGGSPKAGEDRNCGNCGNVFYAAKWKLNDTERNQGTYCSRECKHQARVRLPSDYRLATVGEGEIQCARCGEVKQDTEFGNDPKKRNGKKSYCRDCSRLSVHQWRQRYPDRYEALKKMPRTEVQRLRRRDVDLQKMYRMTVADFDALLVSQGGGCAICEGQPTGSGKTASRLHIDHDHKCCPGVGSCGKCIRGLLCGNCNTLLGLAKEDPDRLRSAIAYLEKGALAA